MANPATMAAAEPTFDLPTGSSSDFYLSREINDREDSNHGKVVKKNGLWRYPYLTRRTGDSLVGTNEEITSSELRHGRTAAKSKLGNASSSGSHDFEYSPETFDDQMEGVFRSEWVRWFNDGEKNLITKDYKTPKGYIHVKGDNGTYNQVATGKNVTKVPLFYTEDEVGDESDPFGLIKISAKNMGGVTRAKAVADGGSPLGKFVAHELHVGDKPVKYSFMSRIPITDKIVRYQDYKHVEVGEINLNVTVNAIVTGSFQLMGSNNPSYYTENAETGKTRMADKMGTDKDVAVGDSDNFYSGDFRDAAEKFLSAVKNTTKSTDTDQFTALEGFLYTNGHQLQFCSDLTMDLNNNLQSIYAIFVKGAIANISPSLAVTGTVTAYFTDGEKDSTGTKFGADDLKNLASENKDVEIVYAFQDKEDPEVIYLFQIFKATFASPDESKNSDSPITLALNYTSYGEMAVRCLRLAVPKVRNIEFDVESVLPKLADGTKEINVKLYPNVPLDVVHEADYVAPLKDNYVFKDAEIYVNTALDEGAVVSGAAIEADGSITAKITLTEDIAKGDDIQLLVKVNDEECEETATVLPSLVYARMGRLYAAEKYENSYIELTEGESFTVLTENDGETKDEDYLFYYFDRAAGLGVTADDFTFSCSDDTGDVLTVDESGVVLAGDASPTVVTVTAKYKYDENIVFSFDVKVVA